MPHERTPKPTDKSLVEVLLAAPLEDIAVDMVRIAIEKTLQEHCYLGILSITILITDNVHIRTLNKQFRGLDEVTDVLSFNEDEGWCEGEKKENNDLFFARGNTSRLGDLVVAIEQVKTQAAQEGHGWHEELAMLAIHGTLHLLGYDHEEKDEAIRMFKLTERIMSEISHLFQRTSPDNPNSEDTAIL